MTREDLIDEVYNALSNTQDMDTTLTDYAKAAVDCLAATVDEQIKAGIERAKEAVRAKGYENPKVTAFFSGQRWLVGCDWPVKCKCDCFGDTFAAAIDELLIKIADLPAAWSDEQVAATLGIARAA